MARGWAWWWLVVLVACGGEDDGADAVPPPAAMIGLERGVSFDALEFHVGERFDAAVDAIDVGAEALASVDDPAVSSIGRTLGDCFIGDCKHVFLRLQEPTGYLVVRNLYSDDVSPEAGIEADPGDAPEPEIGLPAAIPAGALADYLATQRERLAAAVSEPAAQAIVADLELSYVAAGAYLGIERFVAGPCDAERCDTFLALQREDFGSSTPTEVGTLVVSRGAARIVAP